MNGINMDAVHERPTWPDGTPKSQHNAFNWRTGEPSAFSATSQAERQRKLKESKQTS